ncbi:MAG: hypothetical protein GEU90_20875 [Gemmatimonas sp.]|nr:hypothetical protein [Gemmatimonas sp.]
MAVLVGGMAGAGLLSAQVPQREAYPAPAYPRFLVNPTKDQLLQAARIAVRQPYGRTPLGKLQKGDTVPPGSGNGTSRHSKPLDAPGKYSWLCGFTSSGCGRADPASMLV